MKKPFSLSKIVLPLSCIGCILGAVWISRAAPFQAPATTVVPLAQNALQAPNSASNVARPVYDLRLKMDWQLLTFTASGDIGVPVRAGESLQDVVLFVFANAGGVGGSDDKKFNIAIDRVQVDGAPVNWKLNGAVLRVKLPTARLQSFTLNLNWHGVVPRAPAGSGGISDLLGGLGGDMGGMFGLGASKEAKPKNVDYGLYSYGNGILSLGSFWYPTLAVRQNNQWVDEAPEGLGDVAFADMSDYSVQIEVPPNVLIAAPGVQNGQNFQAQNVRDFAVLMSDEFVQSRKSFAVGNRQVEVQAFTTQAHQNRSAQALEVAGRALQIFARRFGDYPYARFVVAEGPMRAGAGGMEYSGMTAIASMLYGDMGKELAGLAQSLGASSSTGPMGDFLGELESEAFGETGAGKTQNRAQAQPQVLAEEAEGANPAGDLLSGLLGQQGEILNSLFETTLAHEVAHQWWAIGVGSDSQRAPWVDESLTNYSSMLYFEDRYGKQKADQMIDLHLKTTYSMGRMLGNADAPVNLRTSQYAGNAQYGAIVYGKGALFYAQLRALMGDAAFFAGLRDYYGRFGGRLANAGALMQTLHTHAPEKKTQISALYKRWIEGTNGDADITGGKAVGVEDLLGGLFGGSMGGEE